MPKTKSNPKIRTHKSPTHITSLINYTKKSTDNAHKRGNQISPQEERSAKQNPVQSPPKSRPRVEKQLESNPRVNTRSS